MRKNTMTSIAGIPMRLTVDTTARRMRLRVVAKDPIVRLTVPLDYDYNEITKFVEANRQWIRDSVAILLKKLEERPVEPKREYTPDQRRQFQERLSRSLSHWTALMRLHPGIISIRYMTSRWGSCNHVSGNISINSRLIDKPDEWLDYVVVHELSHLVHPNHSPAFWAHVERYFPDYKRVRAEMRAK